LESMNPSPEGSIVKWANALAMVLPFMFGNAERRCVRDLMCLAALANNRFETLCPWRCARVRTDRFRDVRSRCLRSVTRDSLCILPETMAERRVAKIRSR
jgi:hypothetical protein